MESPQEIAQIVDEEDCMVCADPMGFDSPPTGTWKLCNLHISRLRFLLEQKGVNYSMRPHDPS